MAVVSHRRESDLPLIGALRRVRDPLLLFVVPVVFALLLAFAGYHASWPIGFDFRGTLWEPARALLDGAAIYPEPTREAVLVGNPAVYPPVFILASVPLALLPVGVAAWLWFFVLAGCVFAAMWILGVRDWRCLVLAGTSPVVVHGLYYGNLTIAMVLLVALAWRYRDNARWAGLALGAAIAAKLFVWPLVVWLLLTRRFRAAAWAVGSAVVLVLGAWALIGFEGFRDYPKLLRVVQDVYAIRSVSIPTVAGALGAPVWAAVSVATAAGLLCLAAAVQLARQEDGDRRVFTVLVAASILASAIVWPNYLALLLVPVAMAAPQLAPAWFFGYVVWLVDAAVPEPTVSGDVCCRPPDVTPMAWNSSHSEPEPWFAAGTMAVAILLTLSLVRRQGRQS